MKIAISGYGRMGKEVEQIALERNHEIAVIIDNPVQMETSLHALKNSDIVIDFSLPETSLQNIMFYTQLNKPIVIGTTGWHDHIPQIKKYCTDEGKSIFYSSNFSIGMNIVFEINRKLAFMFSKQTHYKPRIEEIHHRNKKDSPSGTAITLANDIISNIPSKTSWVNHACGNQDELEIISHRTDNVFGIHSVIYNSEFDEIELKHTAHSRKGFALGAIMAAEWLLGKKGFFTMNNMLNF